MFKNSLKIIVLVAVFLTSLSTDLFAPMIYRAGAATENTQLPSLFKSKSFLNRFCRPVLRPDLLVRKHPFITLGAAGLLTLGVVGYYSGLFGSNNGKSLYKGTQKPFYQQRFESMKKSLLYSACLLYNFIHPSVWTDFVQSLNQVVEQKDITLVNQQQLQQQTKKNTEQPSAPPFEHPFEKSIDLQVNKVPKKLKENPSDNVKTIKIVLEKVDQLKEKQKVEEFKKAEQEWLKKETEAKLKIEKEKIEQKKKELEKKPLTEEEKLKKVIEDELLKKELLEKQKIEQEKKELDKKQLEEMSVAIINTDINYLSMQVLMKTYCQPDKFLILLKAISNNEQKKEKLKTLLKQPNTKDFSFSGQPILEKILTDIICQPMSGAVISMNVSGTIYKYEKINCVSIPLGDLKKRSELFDFIAQAFEVDWHAFKRYDKNTKALLETNAINIVIQNQYQPLIDDLLGKKFLFAKSSKESDLMLDLDLIFKNKTLCTYLDKELYKNDVYDVKSGRMVPKIGFLPIFRQVLNTLTNEKLEVATLPIFDNNRCPLMARFLYALGKTGNEDIGVAFNISLYEIILELYSRTKTLGEIKLFNNATDSEKEAFNNTIKIGLEFLTLYVNAYNVPIAVELKEKIANLEKKPEQKIQEKEIKLNPESELEKKIKNFSVNESTVRSFIDKYQTDLEGLLAVLKGVISDKKKKEKLIELLNNPGKITAERNSTLLEKIFYLICPQIGVPARIDIGDIAINYFKPKAFEWEKYINLFDFIIKEFKVDLRKFKVLDCLVADKYVDTNVLNIAIKVQHPAFIDYCIKKGFLTDEKDSSKLTLDLDQIFGIPKIYSYPFGNGEFLEKDEVYETIGENGRVIPKIGFLPIFRQVLRNLTDKKLKEATLPIFAKNRCPLMTRFLYALGKLDSDDIKVAFNISLYEIILELYSRTKTLGDIKLFNTDSKPNEEKFKKNIRFGLQYLMKYVEFYKFPADELKKEIKKQLDKGSNKSIKTEKKTKKKKKTEKKVKTTLNDTTKKEEEKLELKKQKKLEEKKKLEKEKLEKEKQKLEKEKLEKKKIKKKEKQKSLAIEEKPVQVSSSSFDENKLGGLLAKVGAPQQELLALKILQNALPKDVQNFFFGKNRRDNLLLKILIHEAQKNEAIRDDLGVEISAKYEFGISGVPTDFYAPYRDLVELLLDKLIDSRYLLAYGYIDPDSLSVINEDQIKNNRKVFLNNTENTISMLDVILRKTQLSLLNCYLDKTDNLKELYVEKTKSLQLNLRYLFSRGEPLLKSFPQDFEKEQVSSFFAPHRIFLLTGFCPCFIALLKKIVDTYKLKIDDIKIIFNETDQFDFPDSKEYDKLYKCSVIPALLYQTTHKSVDVHINSIYELILELFIQNNGSFGDMKLYDGANEELVEYNDPQELKKFYKALAQKMSLSEEPDQALRKFRVYVEDYYQHVNYYTSQNVYANQNLDKENKADWKTRKEALFTYSVLKKIDALIQEAIDNAKLAEKKSPAQKKKKKLLEKDKKQLDKKVEKKAIEKQPKNSESELIDTEVLSKTFGASNLYAIFKDVSKEEINKFFLSDDEVASQKLYEILTALGPQIAEIVDANAFNFAKAYQYVYDNGACEKLVKILFDSIPDSPYLKYLKGRLGSMLDLILFEMRMPVLKLYLENNNIKNLYDSKNKSLQLNLRIVLPQHSNTVNGFFPEEELEFGSYRAAHRTLRRIGFLPCFQIIFEHITDKYNIKIGDIKIKFNNKYSIDDDVADTQDDKLYQSSLMAVLLSYTPPMGPSSRRAQSVFELVLQLFIDNKGEFPQDFMEFYEVANDGSLVACNDPFETSKFYARLHMGLEDDLQQYLQSYYFEENTYANTLSVSLNNNQVRKNLEENKKDWNERRALLLQYGVMNKIKQLTEKVVKKLKEERKKKEEIEEANKKDEDVDLRSSKSEAEEEEIVKKVSKKKKLVKKQAGKKKQKTNKKKKKTNSEDEEQKSSFQLSEEEEN